MPVMDGYAATTLLRQDPRFAMLPIIAMTANALSRDRERVLAVGMNDHITKPLDVGAMFATIGKWVVRPDVPAQPPPPPQALDMPRLPPRNVPAFRPPEDAARTDAALPPELADLPGIDARAGLRVMAGNVPFYHRMLRKFAQGEHDFAARFLAAQAAGDADTLVRQAHTLKGLAGNIGAQALYAAAGLLETACQARPQEPAAVDTVLASTTQALAQVLDSIARLDGNADSARASDAEIAELSASDRTALHTLLAQLATLVDHNDADAIDVGGQCIDMLKNTPWAQLIQPLDRALRDYDFERAAELLPGIQSALN